MKICKVFKVLTEAVPLPAELESDRQGKQTVHKLLFPAQITFRKDKQKDRDKHREKYKHGDKYKRRHKCNKPLTNSSLWLRSNVQVQSASRHQAHIKRTISLTTRSKEMYKDNTKMDFPLIT